jgi:hypothetical protein
MFPEWFQDDSRMFPGLFQCISKLIPARFQKTFNQQLAKYQVKLTKLLPDRGIMILCQNSTVCTQQHPRP